MGLFDGLFRSKKSMDQSLPDIEIPRGPVEVEVMGTSYCKVSMVGGDDCVLSVTGHNAYQIEQGWPEHGSVNVNSDWSSSTDETNWIGYIPARRASRLADVIASHNVVRVHARVFGERKPSVTLMLPEDYA